MTESLQAEQGIIGTDFRSAVEKMPGATPERVAHFEQVVEKLNQQAQEAVEKTLADKPELKASLVELNLRIAEEALKGIDLVQEFQQGGLLTKIRKVPALLKAGFTVAVGKATHDSVMAELRENAANQLRAQHDFSLNDETMNIFMQAVNKHGLLNPPSNAPPPLPKKP